MDGRHAPWSTLRPNPEENTHCFDSHCSSSPQIHVCAPDRDQDKTNIVNTALLCELFTPYKMKDQKTNLFVSLCAQITLQ